MSPEPKQDNFVDVDLEATGETKGNNGNSHNVPAWHAMDRDDVIRELLTMGGGGNGGGTHNSAPGDFRRVGLTTEQASQRLTKYGYNQLSEKKRATLLEKIWNRINNILVAILLVVATVSAIRALTTDEIVTNWIQVGIIVGVIA